MKTTNSALMYLNFQNLHRGETQRLIIDIVLKNCELSHYKPGQRGRRAPDFFVTGREHGRH